MRRPKKRPYEPWEYIIRTFGHESQTGDALLTLCLDAAGEQEWELVAFDFAAMRAIFKRRKELPR